ncbi:hypothetical protein J7K50_06165 [bacterium]|nr:hypothetical protein [bacterium]
MKRNAANISFYLSVIITALVCTLAASSCDGNRTVTTTLNSGNRIDAPVILSAGRMIGKTPSGLPLGIRVTWARVSDPSAIGYYLYRNTEPITGQPDENTALRVNSGNIINQAPDNPVQFDDTEFPGGHPEVGETYYYRLTVVNDTSDESDFSGEITYKVSPHSVSGFAPLSGGYGDQVVISGEYFGTYDEETDEVFFVTRTGSIAAEIADWDNINDEITVIVPEFAITGPIIVLIDDTIAITDTDFIVTSPYVLSVSVDHAAEGDPVTVTGANLGFIQGDSTLVFGGEEKTASMMWGNKSITAVVPAIDTERTESAILITIGGANLEELTIGLDPMIANSDDLVLIEGETAVITGKHFDNLGVLTVADATVPTTAWTPSMIAATVSDSWMDGDIIVTTEYPSNPLPFLNDTPLFARFPDVFDGAVIESGGLIPVGIETNINTELAEFFIDGSPYYTDDDGSNGFRLIINPDDLTNDRHVAFIRVWRRGLSCESTEVFFFARVFDGDYNGDNAIDDLDCQTIADYWYELMASGGDNSADDWPTRDGNRDGVIDEQDLAIIGYHWGETRE